VIKFFLSFIVLVVIASCGTSTGPEVEKDAPTNLIAYNTIDDQIQLEWQDNSNAEIGFIIERKLAEAEYVIIDTTAVSEAEFLDVDAVLGSIYTYRVAALFDDEISDYSNAVPIQFTSCSPTNLTIFSTIDYQIILEWEDRCLEETGFVIERKINDLEFVIIDTTTANANGFSDEDLELGNLYSYRVAASVGDQLSAWSNETSLELIIWFEGLEFGTDETFDVVTWNIEHFPKEGQVTVDYLSQLMLVIDAEVYALQEIESAEYFEALLEQINMLDIDDSWAGHRSSTASYDVNLAYVYNESKIQMIEITEIFASGSYSRPFPRRPLLMQMTFQNEEFWIINNHLKAAGNGVMNLNDSWDEETRRFDACNLLDEYIVENLPAANVIVLGDMNDKLDDIEENNVFWNIINEPLEYNFVDMDIAQGAAAYWSYPGWPSHLDHIFITNELFDEFEEVASSCETILVDEYLDNGWYEYDDNISDHRPVGIKLTLD
jgi:endonuclease/exonuclease/phosphatase family metal-dependent hydrolase